VRAGLRAVAAAIAATALAARLAAAQDWKLDSETFEGLRARSIGPGVMSGRIAALDGVAGDRIQLWVGTAGGGVWVSKDGGLTFKPVFDRHVQSIGAIKVDPANPKRVWVGSGETWVRNSVSSGDGLYVTTDGGDNWARVGLERTERIGRIAVDAQRPDTVYAAALGKLYGPGPDRGLYRTRDGGKTWDRVLFVDEHTGCADVAVDPTDGRVVYAAMWQVRRRPWTFASGGPGGGLYKSTDGGATWTKLSRGLPSGELGRIGLAVSPANPQRVYAVVEAKTTAMYRSDDAGATWTKTNDSNANVSFRPFYFAHVIADPKNADRVYKPGLTVSMSEDAGRTFSGGGGGFGGASYHSDVHALWIDPRNPEYLVIGTDGGVYVSYDRGNNWRFVPNLPVGQFYHVSYDMQWPYHVYGGLQDNGTWRGPSRMSGGIPNRKWESLFGGDGFWAFVDPRHEDIAYVEYQGGNLARVTQSTGETKLIRPLERAGEPKFRFNWNTPIHLSPTRDGTLYFGAQFLFRSRDRGDTWERISPDLTTNDPAKQQQDKSGGLTTDNSTAENHCTIYTISESPKDANVVWAGTDDGNVQVTRDGGKTWANVRKNVPGVPPGTWVSYVEASPHDAATCYVAFDGHMLDDARSWVFVTTDFGASWKALGAAPMHGWAYVVKQDLVNPQLLFVGTEFGLWVSLDGGAQWSAFKSGIPAAAVRDLAIHPRESDLIVATHGRGIFIVDDLTPLRALTRDVLASDAAFLPARPSVLVIPRGGQRFDGDADYAGESPSETAVITYYLKKRHLIGDMKVEVYDGAGKLLQTLPGSKRRGINRVDWPMRLKGPKLPPAANLVPNMYAFVGPRTPEGEYTVKLVKGKDTFTGAFRLQPDPRNTHSAEDRAIQHRTVRELYDRLTDLTYLVETMVDVESQADSAAARMKKGDALGARLTALSDRVEALRQELVATKEGRISGQEKLREKLGTLYGNVNGYDGRPTNSQIESTAALTGQLRAGESDFRALADKHVSAINAQLVARQLPPIKVATREEWNAKQNAK
jgi:photosystem II stability/assembly factor-like uncharacterized protein